MEDINIIDGIGVAVVAMSIVFLILILIMACITLFKYLGHFEQKSVEEPTHVVNRHVEKNNLDLANEDMVVASLVAAIDASEEYGCEMRVVSVKECGVE